MSVFLTPDLQPFLGGTYFPPGWHFEPALFTVRDAVHPGLSVYVIILMLLLCLCCRGRLWPPRYSSSQPACTMHAGMHGQHRDHSLTIFCHVWLSSHELFTSLTLRAMRCAEEQGASEHRVPLHRVPHCAQEDCRGVGQAARGHQGAVRRHNAPAGRGHALARWVCPLLYPSSCHGWICESPCTCNCCYVRQLFHCWVR